MLKKIGLSIRLVDSDSSDLQTKKTNDQKSKPRFMENFFAKALKKSIKKKDDEKDEKK